MKALIFYAKYGGGHLSTANAIKEEILNEYPEVEVEMIDCMEYVNKVINKLSTDAYTQMARKVPRVWGRVYKHSKRGALSSVSKTSNRVFALKLKTIIKKINPDIIISTHPFSTQMCAFLKKHKRINIKIANVLTDYQPHEQWLVKCEYVDYFFVSNEEMKRKLIKYGIPKQKIYAYGIPISSKFLKQYKPKTVIKRFKLKENLKTVLFFAGGKYGLTTRTIYKFMISLSNDFDDVQVIAISGQNKKIFDKFNRIVDKSKNKKNMHVIKFSNKIPELMSIADIVITKPRRSDNI